MNPRTSATPRKSTTRTPENPTPRTTVRTRRDGRRSKRRRTTPAAELRHIEHWQRQHGRYPQPEITARIAFHRRTLAHAHNRRTTRTQLQRFFATLARIRPFS